MTETRLGQLIQFPRSLDARVTSGASETSTSSDPALVSEEKKSVESRDSRERRPIEELYPGLSSSSLLQQVQGLLVSALGICERAMELSSEDNVLDADLEFMRMTPVIEELFCCRRLGEGFANTIDALSTALKSADGGIFEREQLRAIRVCIERLLDAPGLSFGGSLELVSELDDAGLSTDVDFGGLIENE